MKVGKEKIEKEERGHNKKRTKQRVLKKRDKGRQIKVK